MLRFDEGEEFFDTVDYLSSDDSVVIEEDIESSNLGYEIWRGEPKSVKERRECFLRRMGFLEPEVMGFERIEERSGAVSCSSQEEKVDCCSRESNGEANCIADELNHDRLDDTNVVPERENANYQLSVKQFGQRESHVYDECKKVIVNKKLSWWKSFKNRKKPVAERPKDSTMKVHQNKKRCMEFTAVYVEQEIRAHDGLIWTMKFSPDGQYLASGGEDGVVRVWHVTSVDASCKSLCDESNFHSQRTERKSSFGMKKLCHASVVIPEKVFQIEELPLHEFHGHTSDVLDLAWSNSNCLLSSSMDKAVRLWQVGCDDCLSVFRHHNYVTCIQFNPVDERYFISGSLDGKVRIWGVSERRVVDWVDVRDVVTAICYQPNGKGFIVGSLAGTCRFYEASDNELLLKAEIYIHGRKKSSGHKITGIQFLEEDSQRVMITSEDSKVRILDGVEVVQKYKGLPKSGSQMSASFTSTGQHIISVGEDSRIYVWNYDDLRVPSSKPTKSTRACEHFFSEGVSVAIPWSGIGPKQNALGSASPRCCVQTLDQQHETSPWAKDSDRFSLSSWFFMEGSCRGSATWPEEKLPSWDPPVLENGHWKQHYSNSKSRGVLASSWGLVIVTGGSDGMIRTFHNYGLPARI